MSNTEFGNNHKMGGEREPDGVPLAIGALDANPLVCDRQHPHFPALKVFSKGEGRGTGRRGERQRREARGVCDDLLPSKEKGENHRKQT